MKKQYNIPQTEMFAVVEFNALCAGSKPFTPPTGSNEEPI